MTEDPRDRQLRDARAEIDRLTTELAEERMRREGLTAAVGRAVSGLSSALAQSAGDPIADLAADAFALPDVPVGAAEDAVMVPVLNVPMRRETPQTPTPADAAAGAEAPTQ